MYEARSQPATIGPFVVLRKLGEGAMGVVYAGYDVALDRKVALKLVRQALVDNAAVRARMVREAQAMARLSHPNVVQVYQVGEHDLGLYVAMEYIDGRTLGAWLRAEPRPWQAALRTVCDAGRGLAAAHAAGLVHRDFKPDNVIVDHGGRARVLDFGLVQSGGQGESDAGATHDGSAHATPADATWSRRLTQGGKVAGTPAYMSPEQHFGLPVGPYSDQFSFAITLYEALYGELPFCADSWEGIRRQIKAGVVPAPSPRSPAPWRLFRVIARALALDPDDRWPSLAAMIAALEHDPWRSRGRVAATVGLLAIASAASYGVASGHASRPRCEAVGAELAGVWDPARARAVSRAFLATGTSYSEHAFARVKARLDDYARAWEDESRAACEADASVGHATRAIDLRIACLGRRRSHLAELVGVFATADRAVVENAVQAVAALPSVAACSDAEALIGGAPPDDPYTAARVEALRSQLARAAVLEVTGSFEPGLRLAVAARAEADTLGWAPLAAEAALVEGRLQLAAANPAKAEAALVAALRLGIAHDLHAVSAEATVRRIFVLGEGLGLRAEALAAEAFADALVQRARDDGRLAALLHNNLGAVHDLEGDAETARTFYARAIDELERRPGPPDPLIAITHNNLGNMYSERGDFARARDHFTVAMRLFTTTLGDAHPFVAHALAGLGDADALGGEHAAAEVSYVRALALMEAAYGVRHLYLLQPLVGLGRVHARLGRAAEAEGSFARALAIADELGLSHPLVAQALEGLAELAARADAPAKAQRLLERAARVHAAVGDVEAGERAVLKAREMAAAPSCAGASTCLEG